MLPETEVPYADEENERVRENWRVVSLEDADWCLKRIADLRREIAENDEVANAHVARVKVRAEKLNARAVHGIQFFEGRLQEYAVANRAALLNGGKKKSRALMYGSLGWRKTGGGLEVVDSDALLVWAQAQPVEKGFVRITEVPALAEIKNHVALTGELPPGTDLKPEVEKFEAKPLEVSDGTEKH